MTTFYRLYGALLIFAVVFRGGAAANVDRRPSAKHSEPEANISNGSDEVTDIPGADVEPLKQLFVVFRHGAKVPSPTFLQGNDTNLFNDYIGQLTNEGKMSLYHLGISIRERYGAFIGNKYDAQRFFLGSTDMERTLMSAQCFGLGLFPPIGDRVWNKKIPWQPIPIFPLQFSLDGNLDQTMKCTAGSMNEVCDNADTLFTEKNKETMRAMISMTPRIHSKGDDSSLDCNFNSLLGLDDLSTMVWYNLTLPAQMKGRETDIDDLKTVFINAMSSPSNKCGKAISGALIKSFLQRIKDLESGRSKQDAAIYSEHDASVMAVVMALSDVAIKSPSFGANLIIEVHKAAENSKQEPQVHMWYAKSAEDKSARIRFAANQKFSISLSEFKKFLQDFMDSIDDDAASAEKRI